MVQLPKSFFDRDPKVVAKEILGMLLVRPYRNSERSGIITGTAAFHGVGARTRKPESMEYEPGTIYMYPYRGHYFLNVTTSQKGEPSCICIGELYPVNGLKPAEVNGPGKLTKALGLNESFDGVYIKSDEIWIEDKTAANRGQIIETSGKSRKLNADNCVGIYRLAL